MVIVSWSMFLMILVYFDDSSFIELLNGGVMDKFLI